MHGLDTRIRSCNIIATVLLGFLVFGQRFSLETRTAPVYPSILHCLCCANYLLYLLSLRILDGQEQLACVFAVTIGIFLASFGVPRSIFFGCLNSWLCNSTLPQEMKTLKDCGGGQCQMEVQNTEAPLAMGNLIRADDLSCRFHAMDSVLQGEDKEGQQ